MLKDPPVTAFALQSYAWKYRTMHMLFFMGLRVSPGEKPITEPGAWFLSQYLADGSANEGSSCFY